MKFSGFPQPKTNFTPVPNLFFDEVLSTLKEAELKVLLYIFRRTYGWQKEMDCISLSQFVNGITTRQGKQLDSGTGLAKSTVIEALKSILKKGYILRYLPGRGSQRRSYYFLNTEKNKQIVKELECGQLSIGQVLGPKSGPKLGRTSGPSQKGALGRKSRPTKRTERIQEKGYPHRTVTESDEAERLREKHTNHKRELEKSTGEPTHLGTILKDIAVQMS